MALTLQQQLFAREYLVDLNATRAAIRAGYSPATARSQGQRLLTNVDIEKFIQSEMDKRAERTGITMDRVLQELATIGFASMGDFLTTDGEFPAVSFAKLKSDQMAAIRDIRIERDSDGRRKVQVKLADKLAALVVMGRHLERSMRPVEQEAVSLLASSTEGRP